MATAACCTRATSTTTPRSRTSRAPSSATARAGIDMVAPSGMLDGFRGARAASPLDEEGFVDTVIMAYSAKYASGYYGPFRDAVDSAPRSPAIAGATRMDSANAAEAVREVSMDVAEGADIVMVKPALAYLDIIRVVPDEITCLSPRTTSAASTR